MEKLEEACIVGRLGYWVHAQGHVNVVPNLTIGMGNA